MYDVDLTEDMLFDELEDKDEYEKCKPNPGYFYLSDLLEKIQKFAKALCIKKEE